MEDARVVYFSQRPIPEPALRPYQRYSRLPPSHEFPNKKRMFEGLQDWSDAAGQPLWFVPETFRLTDSLSSKNNQPLMEMFRKRLYEQGGLDQTWVLKNAALDNGEGITFLPAQSHALKNVQEAMDNSTAKCVEKNPTALQYQSCSTQFVVQRYVDNLLRGLMVRNSICAFIGLWPVSILGLSTVTTALLGYPPKNTLTPRIGRRPKTT